MERALEARAVDAQVTTAGFGSSDEPATEASLHVAEARGLDLDDHRSRGFDATMADVDLVLGMERAHVRDVVVAVPGAWPKSFTLKEAVRRAEVVGPRASTAPFAAWVGRLHVGRRSNDLLGSSPDDDVADPTGGPKVEHEEAVDELEGLVRRFVDLAWPLAPPAH
jgi:protein-tyrosine phosphatase